MRLSGKVAFITGAASGIGRETACLFAREGAKVVLFDINKNDLHQVENEITVAGGEAISIIGDVTELQDCEDAVFGAVQHWGTIDILVNSAGILDYNCSVEHMEEKLWDKVVAINQTGVFFLCRAALRYMERQQYGSIVNVASMAAVSGNSGAAYTASKYAVIGLTKNIAIQYAGTGIRCNAVCPGRTATPMNSDMEYFRKMDHEFMEICGRHMPRLEEKIPPLAQAQAILFFSSDESRYCSGQWLVVDSGADKYI